jgi:hypothetical protein
VVVRLERSTMWPDDLNALRAAKTAFLIQVTLSQTPEIKVNKLVIVREVDFYLL